MVQGPSLDAIAAIREPPSLGAQIDALKRLKNDIVGHDQRKELVVRQGIVEPLVNIISTTSKATGKRRAAETNGDSPAAAHRTWTPEQEARLQAILILGSLASGGPAFVPPLLAAGTSKQLLDLLDTESSPRIITAALQVLRSLAATGTDSYEQRARDSSQIVKHISTPFVTILEDALRKPTSTAHQQLQLIVDIVTFSAKDEKARTALTDHGVLDALALILVSFFIANKHVDYRGSSNRYRNSPPESVIPDTLLAIAVIITGSNYRTQSFMLSQHVCEMMKNSSPIDGEARAAFDARTNGQSPMDGLLPMLHIPHYKATPLAFGSSAFPALASLQSTGGRRVDPFAAERGTDPEHANAVLSWLLYFARSFQSMDRLIALRLAALVNNAIDADVQASITPRLEVDQRAKERECLISMLAIPLAMQFTQLAAEGKNDDANMDPEEFLQIKEQACEVLALLIKDNEELQKIAAEAGATKRVPTALKKTFDNVPIAKPTWPSRSQTSGALKDVSPSCKMGSRGLPPEIQHMMNCRQSALEAVAALADREDKHRKSMIDAGVTTCIIDSLKPFPQDYLQSESRDKITPKDGNVKGVILAACDAAKALSRSVSLLRTSLIDAGIARPIFELLTHQDLDIQVAATNVCCNIILDFSPMREELMNAGAMQTLTEHARQSEMSVRHASLWALKHLVLSAAKATKIQCLEELGVGWLVGAIQGESKESGPVPSTGGVSIGSSGGLSTPNAAGQQVDLLNPASMDVDDPPAASRTNQEEDEDGEMLYDEASSTHYQASQLRSTLNLPGHSHYSTPAFDAPKYLTAIREMEQNPILLAKREDVGIQAQALDFIRNLLNGEDCVSMFEHLLEQIGGEKIFTLLNDKLSPISPPASTSVFAQPKGSTSARPLYQDSQLIRNTIHVLCHIANGSPKHKQLLIAQKQLLQNLLPHFNHPDSRVRVLCVWTVNNLTWIEEESDRNDSAKRVRELKSCGIEAAIRGLVNDDNLDVRERVRTAVRQIDGL